MSGSPPPLKFEKCPFYLGFLGFFTNLFSFFHVMVPFLSMTPPSSEKLDPLQLVTIIIKVDYTDIPKFEPRDATPC